MLDLFPRLGAQAEQDIVVVVATYDQRSEGCNGRVAWMNQPHAAVMTARLAFSFFLASTSPGTSEIRSPMACSVVKSKGVPLTGAISPVGIWTSLTGV